MGGSPRGKCGRLLKKENVVFETENESSLHFAPLWTPKCFTIGGGWWSGSSETILGASPGIRGNNYVCVVVK